MKRFILTSVLMAGIVASPASGQIGGFTGMNWNVVHQRIDGFGASSAFTGFTWTATQADMFFSTNSGTGTGMDGTKYSFTGIGLSLLRSQIQPATSTNGNCYANAGEIGLMQLAQSRGAMIWSTPWTPAAGFKNTNDIYDTNQATGGGLNGGSFIGGDAVNQEYASQLAGYVSTMKNTYGVNLYAISIQNEPDADVTSYPACQWTNTQFHDFVPYLYNALAANGVGSTKIMLPESENWTDTNGLASVAMNDTNVAADVGIIADHNYVADNFHGDQTTPAASPTYGKALWETEVSQIGGGFDGSINNGVYWAERIHLFMTQAQANAYHYWWLINLNYDNEGLTDNNWIPAKRMYTMGNFSRFVRPGYYRIEATNLSGAFVSAYKDPSTSNFTIVAINPSNAPIVQTFSFAGFSASYVTPWLTTSNLSLSQGSAIAISPTNAEFIYSLPPMSVVTFTGQGIVHYPPTLAPISNLVINAGTSLMLTNSATEPNVPPLQLSFSLLTGPTNASLDTIDGSNAVFLWRPLVSQANTVNAVAVMVSDNGTPNLSAINTFYVSVNPLTYPVIGPVSVLGNHVNLNVNGTQGPDYTLLTTTNLAGGWHALYTTNSPLMPLTMVATNSTGPANFYRIQIGP